MFKRILILSASSGNGHVRAAQALQKAFQLRYPQCSVVHVDALDYVSSMLKNLYSKTYIRMVNDAPHLLGLLYDASDKPGSQQSRRLAFDHVNALPLIKFITRYEADLIVCTHFLPAAIVSRLKKRGTVRAHHAIVVTDFDAHAMWLCPEADAYFTAIDETREYLEWMGVPPHNIQVTGIPIDPAFSTQLNKQAARLQLGLDGNLPTIMVSAGGFGVGRIEELIGQFAAMQHRSQVLFMCGRNERLLNRLRRFAAISKHVQLVPIGYTDDVPLMMAASDLIVGKPGGLTTCEALAMALPYVVVNPIPGQEERNADHLLEEGAAIRCNTLPTLAYKIDRLLNDPEKLDSLRKAAFRLGRADAAVAIVDHLMGSEAGVATPLAPRGTLAAQRRNQFLSRAYSNLRANFRKKLGSTK